MKAPILELRDITCYFEKGTNLFSNLNIKVDEGDILVLQGRSGSGKSTLLKCIAHLVMHSGQKLYRGKTPQEHGIPAYRTRVMYVPQRPSLLPGSPHDFLESITQLKAHHAILKDDSGNAAKEVLKRAVELGERWGIDAELWNRGWATLSGGEGQRMLIASALSLNTAEVLLLDEPTSALDSVSSDMVERFICDTVHDPNSFLKAVIWITHSEEQGQRVGTRFMHMSAGSCYESHGQHTSA
jgi:ABC-type iron transport system FetAB ATPase subunit